MARFALLISAITLWSVCRGYGIPEYEDSPNEYPVEPTEHTDLYTDEFDSEATKVPVPEKFRCLSDGLFAYPPDCARFIQCSNGRPFLISCPEDLHFSERTKRCENRCEAQCDPAISEYCRGKKELLFKSDALLVPEHCLFNHIHNQSTCQSFDDWNNTAAHSCLDRTMQLRSFTMLLPCGVDLFFGVAFVCCPKNAKVFLREHPTEPTEYTDLYTDEPYSEASKVPVPEKYKFRCFSDGLFAYPPDCASFIQCSNGRPFLISCPEGLHFNKRINTCDYPCEAQCDPAIKCNRDEPTEYTDVYTDEFYSEATKVPVPQKYKFRCLSDGLFAYPPDCASFIQCSNGRAYLMSCPEGLHFNKRTNRCDYPCEAQCNPAISEYCRTEKADEVCSLPPIKGECKSYLVRYYYDVSETKCKKFVYGGCKGNGNNFKSEKQCVEICGKGDPWGYGYRLNSQKSTDDSWTSENDASSAERDSKAYPVRSATESTEDYLSYSTDIGPQEPGEDSWGTFTTSEYQTTEDSSWGGDSDQPSGQQYSRLPEEDSVRFSTESQFSFMDRVVDDFKCLGNRAYRNSGDCTSFIWCYLDRAIVVPCPPNTHYSQDRDECVDPCLAHCNATFACACKWAECHIYNHFDCEAAPDAGPCSDRELRYFYDRESGRCKSFYYGGCHGNGNNYRTLKECQKECQVSLLAGFRCPSYNGDFGHYPDCVSYYQCKRAIPTLKRCPAGTAFHHLKAKCVPEEEAMCVYECREPNATYPAPKDCRSYIDCVNGIPKLFKCPRGMAFDINKGRCALERSTSCNW